MYEKILAALLAAGITYKCAAMIASLIVYGSICCR